MADDLKKQLREHNDDRLYLEADVQKSVADAIHRRLRKLGFVEIPS